MTERFPNDPQAAREHEQYPNPIPSREYIMQYLSTQTGFVTNEQLISHFNLKHEDDLEALRRRLSAMLRDGQLLCDRKHRYALVSKTDLFTGTIVAYKDGYGSILADEGGGELSLSPKQMRDVLHGDRVLANVMRIDEQGKREARIVEVLDRADRQLIGRIYFIKGFAYLAPETKFGHEDILIAPEDLGGALEDQMVVVSLVDDPLSPQPLGRVVEVLGDYFAPGLEIEVAIRTHHLPNHWTDAVLKQAKAYASTVPEESLKNREDLRDKCFVTIDGEDAKDFDDAVYCEALPKGGWRLWVAIADVSHYVTIGSALDLAAQERGNSVYFPGRVIPMLPEVLSNDLCSLNPNVDRLCMVCECDISAQGELLDYRFARAAIHSHGRLTYTQVANILEGDDYETMQRCADLLPHLYQLYDLYQSLIKAREIRGAIDFASTETRIIFGDNKKIEKIVPVERNVAHRLIEECMLTANVATAKFLEHHEIPILYRIHEKPRPEKLGELRQFLKEFGLTLKGGDDPEPSDYAALIQAFLARPDTAFIQTVLLRSLTQAVYSPDNVGHFGLAYDAYTHFTSPIRRYPDLLVHRAIGSVIDRKPITQATLSFMRQMGEHCSMTERRADEATRGVTNWLKCEYMQSKLGEFFQGTVSGVTHFGLFVQLNDIYVDGLVHISALPNAFYHHDPISHQLVSENGAFRYRLGDQLRVRVVRVDLDQRKMDFDLG